MKALDKTEKAETQNHFSVLLTSSRRMWEVLNTMFWIATAIAIGLVVGQLH